MNIEINNTGDNSHVILGKEALSEAKIKTDKNCTKEELINELESNRKIISRLFRKRTTHWILVSTILLITVSVYSFLELTTEDEKETFRKYYKLYSERKSINHGIEAFINRDYTEAAKNLTDTIVIDARIYKAISLIEEEEYRMAGTILNKIDTQEAEWLWALCLLRIEHHFEAKHSFEKIYEGKGLFSQQAKEILQEHYYAYSSYKNK